MKILLLTTHMNMGGIARYVANLARSLKRRGHTVYVSSSGGDLEEALANDGIRHVYTDIRTKSELSPKIIRSFLALKRFLKEEDIKLIHAHTRVTQVLSALLSLDKKTPYVTTCHGFFKRRLGRMAFACWGDKVIAISEAVKEQLARDFRVDEKRIALVHTGIEVDHFLRGISEEKKSKLMRAWNINTSPVIGTIGRLSSVKGQDVLLNAAKTLISDFSDINILLVGNGPEERRLKELSSRLGLAKNVVFTGSVGDTMEALSLMDVFVLPSIKEGLGLALAEAMASGRPCVASRVGGIKNLLEDGVTGILVEPGNAEGLARAIKYILDNKAEADSFKEKARDRIVKDFNIDDMAAKIESVYEEVLGRHHGK